MDERPRIAPIPAGLWAALAAKLQLWGDAPRGDAWDETRVRIEVANLCERFAKVVCCNLAAGLTPVGYLEAAEDRALWPLIDKREASGDLREPDYIEAKAMALVAAERVVGRLADAHPLAFPMRAEVWPDRLYFHKQGHHDCSRQIARMIAAACDLLETDAGWVAAIEGPKGAVGSDGDANAPARSDGRYEPAGLALTNNDTLVLQTLTVFDASQLVSTDAIAAEMDAPTRLSVRTIGPIVQKLMRLDLAERPEGRQGGARLTMAGRRLASKIAN